MKKSGIKIDFAKPRSHLTVLIQQRNKLTTTTSH